MAAIDTILRICRAANVAPGQDVLINGFFSREACSYYRRGAVLYSSTLHAKYSTSNKTEIRPFTRKRTANFDRDPWRQAFAQAPSKCR